MTPLRFLAVLALAALPLLASFAGEPAKSRRVAVTIDDGPAVNTDKDLAQFVKISDALREVFAAEKVPVIMFVNERQFNVDGQRDARVAVLHRWLEAGLDLGNHAYSHPNPNQVGLPAFLDDIVKGEVITRPLMEARNRQLVWFRYPYLATGNGPMAPAIEEFLSQRGYRIAPVTVDYADYNHAGAYSRHLRAGDRTKADEQFSTMLQALDAAFARAETRSKEILGYEIPMVLLIHCNEMNSLTLRQSLQRMRERGYTFVSLDEAMADPAYKLPLRPGAMGGGGLFNAMSDAKHAKVP